LLFKLLVSIILSEYLSENVNSKALGFKSIFLIAFIVLSPPHIKRALHWSDIDFVNSSLSLYLIMQILVLKDLYFFFQ
jgi:hypothetical protein